MNIYLIRHGETDWNVIGRLQGREDIPLNENGRIQAQQCGFALSKMKLINMKWKVIISSTLTRARQTADIIAGILDIHKIYEDNDLVERDYGQATGLTEDERAVLFPDGRYEGIEKWNMLRNRAYGAVLKAADMFYPEDIIIVSHGGAINAILAELSNHSIGTGKNRLKNACVNMLEYKEKSLNIVFYNKAYYEL